MTKIKSYTDLEQSKKLAKILPHQSADMSFNVEKGYEVILHPYMTSNWIGVPCWSLTALLSVLPYPYIEQNHKGKWICRVEHKNTTYLWEDSNPVDACYEIIIKLNELNLL